MPCSICNITSQQGEVEVQMPLSKWFLSGVMGRSIRMRTDVDIYGKGGEEGLTSLEFAMG
jgi:hypothetical protein